MRQAEALEFVRAFYETKGIPPTCREIGEHMGVRSSSTSYAYLTALERKGYLQGNGKRGFIPVKERVA